MSDFIDDISEFASDLPDEPISAPQTYEQRIFVDSIYHGVRLDVALSRMLPWRSRTELQKIIRSRIRVNNITNTRPSKRLASGDIIYIQHVRATNDSELTDVPEIHLLFEDDYYVIVDKPPLLTVHPTSKYLKRNVVYVVRQRYAGCDFKPTLIHRLDRETSGVLLMAKDGEIAGQTQALFGTEYFIKEYVAIVEGRVPDTHFFVDIPLGRAQNSKVYMRQGCNYESGVPSRTEFHVLSQKGNYALIFARLYSGRQHQIRAHLNHLGLYIVGDKIYGKNEEHFLRFIEEGLSPDLLTELELSRHALHAFRVSFKHPYLDQELSITAPLPPDMLEYAYYHGLLS